MGFLLESPVQLADSQVFHLSTLRGALHNGVKIGRRLTMIIDFFGGTGKDAVR